MAKLRGQPPSVSTLNSGSFASRCYECKHDSSSVLVSWLFFPLFYIYIISTCQVALVSSLPVFLGKLISDWLKFYPSFFQVTVCAHYIVGGAVRSSNMAVMEVNLPSGFTANLDALPALRRYPGVKKVDSERGDTKVVLYFASLGRSEVCPTIEAFRTSRVANQKPASVLVYDYYDQSRRARAFYRSVKATLCDICDPASPDECPDDGCPDRPTPSFSTYSSFGSNVDVPGSAPSTHSDQAHLVLAFVLISRLLI